MDHLDACARRVWRLAWLLNGGDPRAAAAASARVLGLRRDLTRLDPARLDRLCVLAARRVASRPGQSNAWSPGPIDPPHAALRSAAAMPRQCLEAWILTRIEQLDPIRVARAMDCSRTAAERHLHRADELMAGPLRGVAADGGAALTAVRAALDAIDPGPEVKGVRRRIRRRRRMRLALFVLCAAAAVLGAVLAAQQLM